ncbi:MAG: hypothetical protein CVT49_08925 [candidate division Zixibacteria bacterium HGW-Zixibacteria-1]|nr:MAG: hypothetical protein CVT49_08925 [candidate division Zixibacteria bacterium HGW-Zixibacteria-1]
MVKVKKGNEKKVAKELEELMKIRKLLMVILIRDGVDSSLLGDILEIDASTIRHMMPMKKLKRS